MSHCTCDYHQDQNKKSEWDVSDNGVQWTGDDFFKAKEKDMNKIEKLAIRGWGVVEAIAAIIPAINELIDAHNETVMNREVKIDKNEKSACLLKIRGYLWSPHTDDEAIVIANEIFKDVERTIKGNV